MIFDLDNIIDDEATQFVRRYLRRLERAYARGTGSSLNKDECFSLWYGCKYNDQINETDGYRRLSHAYHRGHKKVQLTHDQVADLLRKPKNE